MKSNPVGWFEIYVQDMSLAKALLWCTFHAMTVRLRRPVPRPTAALMLFDEGRFALNDLITRWAPEFSQVRVLRSSTGTLDQTDPAERPITFEDLLTHRSGLTYGDWHPGPIAQAYKEALGGD